MFIEDDTSNRHTKLFDHPVIMGVEYIGNLDIDKFFTWTQIRTEKHFSWPKLCSDTDSDVTFCDQTVKKIQILFENSFVTWPCKN